MIGANGFRKAALLAGLAALLAGAWTTSEATALRFCDQPAEQTAAEKDRILRFGAVVKSQLEQSGHRLALISRSGLDLRRFGVRYSHSGVSLRASAETPWSVRQLYFACDERRPKVFDQGMSGFLFGLDDPAIGYVSLVLLPGDAEAALERAALDNRRALQLLGSQYSANAYPFSQLYQNCNQWLIEMLAAAWGLPEETEGLRGKAQAWLQDRGYRPTVFELSFPPPAWLGSLMPLLHHDDHPRADVDNMLMRVSMPASVEQFVRDSLPGAQRIELCHTERHVVIRRGWQAIADGCQPGPGDSVVSLLDPPR